MELLQLLSSTLDELPQLMGNELQSVREHVASLMVSVCAYLLEEAQATGGNTLNEAKRKAQVIPEHSASFRPANESTSCYSCGGVDSLAELQDIVSGLYSCLEQPSSDAIHK